MKICTVLFCLEQLFRLFPSVIPSTLDDLHLVRCLRTISEQYLPETQTLAIVWTQYYLLYHNITSGMTPASESDERDYRYMMYKTERDTLNDLINMNTLVDLLFSELSRWTIVVFGNTSECNAVNYDVCGSYVILTTSVTLLQKQLRSLSNCSYWNPRGRFVVALLNNFYDPPLMAHWLLKELWKHKITNSLVLVPNEEGESIPALNAYTWYPYHSTRQCVEVKNIGLLDTWVKKGNGYFLKKTHLFPQKISKNLHRCPLRIATVETIYTVTDPYTVFLSSSNITKLMYKDGWEVKLLNIIAKTMNMTLHYLDPLHDFWDSTDGEGNYAGFTRELLSNRADVSLGLIVVRTPLPAVVVLTRPHHWGRLSWYVPCGIRYPRWMSISRMFPGSVWILLMMSIALSVAVFTFLTRFSDDSHYKTESNTFFITWASILSVSVPAMHRTWPLRCFFMSWLCYSLAVGTVFQTYLTSFLVDPGIMPHPRNLKELARSDMKLGFAYKDEVFYQDRTDSQARQILAKKVECSTSDTCYIWAKKYKNVSILTSDLLYKFQSSKNPLYETSSHSLCQIEDGVVERGPIVMVLPKGSVLFDRINDIIFRVVESGVFGEWVKMTDHMQMVKEKAFFPGGLSDEYYKLSLEHLQSAFYLLLFGYCLSFVILVTEHIGKGALFS